MRSRTRAACIVVLSSVCCFATGCLLDFPKRAAPDASPDSAIEDASMTPVNDAALGVVPSDGSVDATMPSPNVIFATSLTYQGNLGRDAYDAICAEHAERAHLAGSFVALLSVGMSGVRERLQGARGWVNTLGMPFADSVDAWAGGRTLGPVLDEYGRRAIYPWAWTGASESLDTSILWSNPSTCGDWSELTGLGMAGTPDEGAWTTFAYNPVPCKEHLRVYCATVDRNAEVRAPSFERVRRVFVSDGSWFAMGGIDAADAICRRESSERRIDGDFIALLADVGRSALDRLEGPRVPWVRLDGALLWKPGTGDPYDLVASPAMSLPSSFEESDTQWTGAPMVAARGTAETTCNGWRGSSDGGVVTAIAGVAANRTASWFYWASGKPCDERTHGVYCIEQLTD